MSDIPHLHSSCERTQVSGRLLFVQDPRLKIKEDSLHKLSRDGAEWLSEGRGALPGAKQSVDVDGPLEKPAKHNPVKQPFLPYRQAEQGVNRCCSSFRSIRRSEGSE